jgi:hypothetical protein
MVSRFPRPVVNLGQHVMPLPAGQVALRAGTIMSMGDSSEVTLFGRGGHGSSPQYTIDPVVMAAATVMRLQAIVSREIAMTDSAVVSVGTLRAGTSDNIIPDQAHHLIAKADWSDTAVLALVRARVVPAIQQHGPIQAWIIDDTGFQEGQALGRRCTAVLWPTRQAAQLPGRSQPLDRQRARQPAGGVAAVPAAALGRRCGTAQQGRHARRAALRHQATDGT